MNQELCCRWDATAVRHGQRNESPETKVGLLEFIWMFEMLPEVRLEQREKIITSGAKRACGVL